ncbi:hypothetical protein Salat_0496900 [Sesamum alatum]|uniref:CCHC-type domain-containing protein n=1 Tax=Sesamum alatum TaxID=300844 RepID=A0AAE2D0X3_9LAMI|nr:hypothetical protein Salat_0496900 [Sesamum alatum]
MAYYGKLKVMWDELVNCEPISTCRFGGCKCSITAKLEKKREENRVRQFLMGFDDVIYRIIHSNILSINSLSSLNRVYAIIIQEELHREIDQDSEERGDVVGFATQANYGARVVAATARPNDKIVICTNCGKPGHEVNECFKITGYPYSWRDGP